MPTDLKIIYCCGPIQLRGVARNFDLGGKQQTGFNI